jgi:hypothetical protein
MYTYWYIPTQLRVMIELCPVLMRRLLLHDHEDDCEDVMERNSCSYADHLPSGFRCCSPIALLMVTVAL